MKGVNIVDKSKLIYDLSLICVKQCLIDTQPSCMDETCNNVIQAFENAYSKISASIEPVFEKINDEHPNKWSKDERWD